MAIVQPILGEDSQVLRVSMTRIVDGVAYAVLHKQKPLIVAQSVSIACNLLVVGGWMFNNWIR